MFAARNAPPNLGVVITNPTARKSIYGGYAVAMTVFGATQVGFAAVSAAQPDWLTISLAVLAYLGIPVGGLALANTSSAPKDKSDVEGKSKVAGASATLPPVR